MSENYKYTITKEGLHLAKGNNKIGKTIWAFATVPGNAEHRPTLKDGTILSNVIGTCSKYCEGCAKNGACYAWRDFMLHNNATVKAWSENTNLLRSGKLFEELDNFISDKNKDPNNLKMTTFRINTSGEIESLEQFEGWNNLAKKHPEVTFGIYTKSYDVIEAFLMTKKIIADNFVVNISQWNHVADSFLEKHPGMFNVFEYDDTQRKDSTRSSADIARLRNTTHCPAVDCKGRHATKADGTPITCDMCKRCYTKTGRYTAVYAH